MQTNHITEQENIIFFNDNVFSVFLTFYESKKRLQTFKTFPSLTKLILQDPFFPNSLFYAYHLHILTLTIFIIHT